MNKKNVNYKDYRVANLERWKAMQGLRSSNAAQSHVLKKFKGTRKSNKDKSINEQLN